MDIINALSYGQQNAKSRAELQALSGLCDREVRREIRRLRLSGIPVCSSSRVPGYWLPETSDELSTFQQSMAHRVRAIFSAASSARRIIHEVEAKTDA